MRRRMRTNREECEKKEEGGRKRREGKRRERRGIYSRGELFHST